MNVNKSRTAQNIKCDSAIFEGVNNLDIKELSRNVVMNGDSVGPGSSSSNSGGGQDANGNLSSNNLGARPKVRSSKFSNAGGDQVVPHEIRDDNDEKEENSDDDFYVYRYDKAFLARIVCNKAIL